jgi:transposase
MTIMHSRHTPTAGPPDPRSTAADAAQPGDRDRFPTTAVIAIKDDQRVARRRKGSRGGRPPSFDEVRYRDRNTVERAVNKLRAHRAVATRYDKRDYIYRGTITVAAILIWLRDPVAAPLRDTP